MNGHRSPAYESECAFIPVNLHDQTEVEEFITQRKACGWHYSDESITKFRGQSDAKEKTIFWITLTAQNGIRAGHISLDSLNTYPDEQLRNSDRSIMTIKTFFILPGYRKFGLGRKAMDAMEDLATKSPHGSPNCKAIVVDTVTKRYYYEPEMIKERERWRGEDRESTICNQEWYERRGYRQFKEEPTYQEEDINGKTIYLIGSFLRKDLTS